MDFVSEDMQVVDMIVVSEKKDAGDRERWRKMIPRVRWKKLKEEGKE